MTGSARSWLVGVLAVGACLACCLVPPALLAAAGTGTVVAMVAVVGGLLTQSPWLVAVGALVAGAVVVGGGYAVVRRGRAEVVSG